METEYDKSEISPVQGMSQKTEAAMDDSEDGECAAKISEDDDDQGSFRLSSLGAVLKNEKKDEVLRRLAQTDAHFKHQQRGDPDLTVEEKVQIAFEILENSPTHFLRRFHSHLTLEDLDLFEDLRGDYEVDFYLKEVQDRLDKSKADAKVKNRRYMALQRLAADGEYFSEDEMKRRDPLLYEEMVGRFMTDDEVKEKVENADLTFSSFLLKHYDQMQENALYDAMKEREDDQKEEEDSDEEEEEMDASDQPPNQPDSEVSAAEKLQLRAEFRRTMEIRFLSGQDRDFDYSKVDEDTAYDDLDALDQAAQDKYFDED